MTAGEQVNCGGGGRGGGGEEGWLTAMSSYE